MSINCCNCHRELDVVVDTTYSNINTDRCNSGEHTGDIYVCDVCEISIIDNFLSGSVEYWVY